jgi:regulator of replication initiation timing
MSRREEYTAKIKAQLDDMNMQMDELSAKANEIKADAREAYNLEMDNLRLQSKLAVSKYEELKTSGEDTWDKMVAEMNKISDALVHSFNYFKSQT